MKRRGFLTAIATTAMSGCVATGSPSSTQTETPTDSGVMNPTYLGRHDDHTGPEMTEIEYSVHSACNATIMVWFDSEPATDSKLVAWFYKNGELVEKATQKIAELDHEMRENLELQYCSIDKFDAFRVAVTE